MTWPGSPGRHPGLRTGGLLCAVWCGRSEGAVLGYTNPTLKVCLLGHGSAGVAPGCIIALVGLMAALDAPSAVACFARGWLHLPASERGDAPCWTCVSRSPVHDLTPTYNWPWLLASAVPGLTAAALQVEAVPIRLGALAITSLSVPSKCLPHLLGRFRAARADDGGTPCSI